MTLKEEKMSIARHRDHLLRPAFSYELPSSDNRRTSRRAVWRVCQPRFLAGIGLGVFLSLPTANAQEINRPQIEKIIREYILQNPEIIEEALEELQTRAKEADAKARSAVLTAEKQALFQSEADVVLGNPEGDVTLVEFFDFNCGYCKRAAPDLQTLISNDPKLRVVLKDFPILGEQSVEAAKIGLAIKRLEGDAAAGEFHKRLIASQGRADGARALDLAQELGIDRQRLQAEAASKEVEATIGSNLALAQRLGLTGTPSFVVGDQVIEGAVGEGPLKEAIQAVRQ